MSCWALKAKQKKKHMSKKVSITLIILVIAVAIAAYIYKYNNSSSMTRDMKNDIVNATTTAPVTPVDPDENRAAVVGDLVVVHYTGTLENGTKFDSSYDRGEPLPFLVGKGMVIKGWDEGLLGMKKGEKKHLVIPGDKAYGDQEIKGADGKVLIPKNATLIFDVEVVQVVSAERVAELMSQQQARQALQGTSTVR